MTRNGERSNDPPRSMTWSLDLPGQPFFLQLARDQPGGERRRVNRHLQIGGHVGQRADMILMPVGDDDPDEVLHPLLDEFEVGQDEVDPRIFMVGEGQSAIGHQPFAAQP